MRFYNPKFFTNLIFLYSIPKRNQLFNDTINCHKALLTAVNFNNQHRSHLTALIITKISNMKQEAELIKINTAKNEMEGWYRFIIRFEIIFNYYVIFLSSSTTSNHNGMI